MVSSRLIGSHPARNGFSMDRVEVPYLTRHTQRSPRRDVSACLCRADGMAVQSILVGLLVLMVGVAGAFYYWRGRMGENTPPPSIAVDGNEVRHLPRRYKIQRPEKPTVTGESVSRTEEEDIAKAPLQGSPAGGAVGLAQEETQEAVPSEQSPPIQPTDLKPSPGGPLPSEEEAQVGRASQEEKGEVQVMEPVPDQPAQLRDAVEPQPMAAFEPGGTSSPLKGEVRPPEKPLHKGFFVQTDVANLRDRPSTGGNVLFQIGKGRSVTGAEQKGQWCRIRTDDGRSGWVHCALLSDVPVPQSGDVSAKREIRAIRVEPRVHQRARVFFEVSPPAIPEILVLEGERPRVVCDFLDAVPDPRLGDRMVVGSGIIQTIRIGLHPRPRPKVRIVLDLKPGPRYAVGQFGEADQEGFALEVRTVEDPQS